MSPKVSKKAPAKAKPSEKMKKATSTKEKSTKQAVAPVQSTPAPSTPASLGTKRACPKCSAKFYDFGKEEVNCPKCSAKLKVADLKPSFSIPLSEPKKPKVQEKVTPEAVLAGEEDTVVAGSDTFESVEDLADAEDDVVDIAVVKDDDAEDF